MRSRRRNVLELVSARDFRWAREVAAAETREARGQLANRIQHTAAQPQRKQRDEQQAPDSDPQAQTAAASCASAVAAKTWASSPRSNAVAF